MKNFKKISRKDIEQANAEDKMLGTNANAAQLFKVLASGEGFGRGCTAYKSIADQIYTSDPTINNHIMDGQRKTADTRTRGDTRVANLARGGASFILEEAKFFHLAFTNVFGQEWGALITPKELVLSNPRELFNNLLSQGLPWPANLPVSTALSSLNSAGGDGTISIKPVDAEKLNLSGSKEHKNKDLQSINPRPLLKAGSSILINLQRTIAKDAVFFLFEVSECPMIDNNKNEPHEIFPLQLFQSSKCSEFLKSRNGKPFSIYDMKGNFSYYIIQLNPELNFQDLFNCNPEESRWNLDTGRIFIKNLRKYFLSHPDEIQIAQYEYQVI